MKKRNCTNCGYSEFDKTKSGRRNLDHGKCMVAIVLPNSFMSRFYDKEFPSRNSISKNTPDKCDYWKRIL